MTSKATKKPATKKESAPAAETPAGGRIIDLDVLLDTPASVRLGGRVFLGRECTVLERERYIRSEAGTDAKKQRELTAALLNARIGDGGEPVTIEWVGERTPTQLMKLVRHLLGLPMDPANEGNG